ncbi:Cobalamin biosynthesis protein CobD [Paraconexibacter sp. AEG42_29]|uniref:Cobalamin biosynthesis protein CobD n=1 Tax=Paraconexibacter sp. AEG42_29 TaxID=2997339 RepID=A0AAU7AQ73_9ACTN
MTGAGLAGGYVADLLLGDPARRHPVAGFGQAALRAEAALYAPSRPRGVVYAGVLVGGAAAAGALAGRTGAALGGALGGDAGRRRGATAVLAAVTWGALGGRSLTRVAGRLADDLERSDLAAARTTLPSLCGRDPEALDADGLARAALESVAENTSDAVVGALFWGAVAGPGGVAAYRAANTLDAMVGHRSDRYREFGWAAAKLDDALNWPPARLAAGLTAVCAPVVGGAPDTTLETVLRDGAKHPSPNAGRVESAFAGALGVRLGGPLAYAGRDEIRPTMGDGRAPTATDVHRATRLSLAVGAAATIACAAARTLIVRLRTPKPVVRHPVRWRTGLGAKRGGT